MADEIPVRVADLEDGGALMRDVGRLKTAVFGDDRYGLVGLVALRSDTQRVIAAVDNAARVLKWAAGIIGTVGSGVIVALIAS